MLNEERTARKRAEKEYDSLLAHYSNPKQDKNAKQKHPRIQPQPKEINVQSPIRKKSCSRSEHNELEMDITPLESNKPNNSTSHNDEDQAMFYGELPDSDAN